MPDPEFTFTRDSLTDALTRLEMRVMLTGPVAGMINAESMADAIIEALGQAERTENDRESPAVTLLKEALHLRTNGEYAPGGTENWHDWDLRAELFLRSLLPEECRHCGAPIRRCRSTCATAPDYPLCKGWRHTGYDDQPVIGHCCGGRSINPPAEPREEINDHG